MMSKEPGKDTDVASVMRWTMEALAAPALACGRRSCRRHRRCTGSGLEMEDTPCYGRLPSDAHDQFLGIRDLHSVIGGHILRGEPIDRLKAADPAESAMAVTLFLRMIPKRRWRWVRRALAKAGIPSPLPSRHKPTSKRHKNATR